MAHYQGYRDLDCYIQARELRKSISEIVRLFPKEEKFQLTSQLIRASRSVTANIAEGYGRFTYSDTRHFFIMARGSITETMEHLQTAADESYINSEILREADAQCERVFKLINGFITYLKTSKAKQ